MDLSSVVESRLRRLLRVLVVSTGKPTLSGKTVRNAIQSECGLTEDIDILAVAKQLMTHGYISVSVTEGEANELKKPKPSSEELNQSAEYTVSTILDEEYVLNRRLSTLSEKKSTTSRHNAVEIAVELRKKITSLFGKFLKQDGSGVDYEGASKSLELVEYGLIAEQLSGVDVGSLEQDIPNVDERKALYLNLYNALVIHGHIAIGNPTNPQERTNFFTKTAYDVGGEIWTLDVIEHGFLRCNKKKPFATHPVVDPMDVRAKHALAEPVDPRVHFALNCGAKSCPPIRFYSAEKLNDQLNMAARGFFKDESNLLVLPLERKVKLTKLLEWYGGDFAAEQVPMLEIISGFLEADKSKELNSLLASARSGSGPIHIEFYAYDWSENN